MTSLTRAVKSLENVNLSPGGKVSSQSEITLTAVSCAGFSSQIFFARQHISKQHCEHDKRNSKTANWLMRRARSDTAQLWCTSPVHDSTPPYMTVRVFSRPIIIFPILGFHLWFDCFKCVLSGLSFFFRHLWSKNTSKKVQNWILRWRWQKLNSCSSHPVASESTAAGTRCAINWSNH